MIWRPSPIKRSYFFKESTYVIVKADLISEEDVNVLSDDDWIIHLDEETLLTEASVRGIINFICEGKHSFGQGLITYASNPVQFK